MSAMVLGKSTKGIVLFTWKDHEITATEYIYVD